MARVRGSIDIDRPIDEVFDVVADQTNEPLYNPAMTASHRLDDGPIGVGTRFRATVLTRGKPQEVEIEITGFERPGEMASRSVMGRSTVTGRLRFDPIASGTRLNWDWDVRVGGVAQVLGPLVGVIGRRQERAIWGGLKHFLENGAAAQAARGGIGMTTTRPGRTSQPSTASRPRRDSMPPDPSWQRLYRAGAWAAAVYVVLVLAPMVMLATAPLPPSSGAAVLEYIDTHGVVYLAELVCFVGLSVPALVVFSAWAMALKHVDKSMALIGGLFGVASEITALAVGSSPQSLNGGLVVLSTAYQSATTADERAGLASAADAIIATTNAMPWAGVLTAAGILVLSLVAWRGPVPAGVAALGIVTGAVGIAAESLRPLIDYGYLIYGLLLPTWFILTGWTLHTLGRHPMSASQPRTDDPANDHARPAETTGG